jgi:DNA-binding response OmpR family regulator
MRVLIVEDELRMAQLLRKGLEEEGCSVIIAADGEEGLAAAQTCDFDVIVLDVMLPGIDGFEVARRLRKRSVNTPILMLTARDTIPDEVRGLDCGSDDYLTKPFSFEVLLARLRALARRGASPRPLRLQVADLMMDPATHQVFRGSDRIMLTGTEYRLLEFLMRRAGKVVRRDTLIEAIWSFDSEIQNNTLDAFVSLLRSKIDRGRHPQLLHTIRSIGYCLREDSQS